MCLKVVLLCVSLCHVSVANGYVMTDCPSTVRYDIHTYIHATSCYYFVTNQAKSYQTAETICRNSGGRLAKIDDRPTQDFVVTSLKARFSVRGQVWFGLRNSGPDGIYIMPNGAAPNFTNWAPDEPAPMDINNGCAVVDIQQDGMWKVFRCHIGPFFPDEVHNFICEFPLENDDTTTTSTTTTTTPEPTTTTPEPTTTTAHPPGHTTTAAESDCPPFQCTLDCGLSGYRVDSNGCLECECD